MFYATLCDMVLYLHKDDRSFKQSSAFGTPSNAIRVHHCLATRATDYIKKQHVFRLQAADWSQTLFQARLDTIAGCLKLLEILKIYWNLKTLLEILEIYWNLIGPGNFCVRCRRSTAFVSSHTTGYQMAYLRNWLPYFIFATAPCCIKCILYFCSISRQNTSVHYIGGRRKANMSWIFLKIPRGISRKFA